MLNPELVRQQAHITEMTVNPSLNTAIAIVDWGLKLETNGPLQEAITEHLGYSPELKNSGFAESRWSLPLENEQSLLDLQIGVTAMALFGALESLNAAPEDLNALLLGTSIPANADIATTLAALVDVDPALAQLVVAACFSTAFAFSEQVKHTDSSSLTAVGGVETVTALRSKIDDGLFSRGITDPWSLNLFSDRAFFTVFDPSHFKIILQTRHGALDTQNSLGCVNIVPVNGAPVEGFNNVLVENNQEVFARIPDPDSSQAIFMNPSQTTKNFLRLLDTLNRQFFTDFHQITGENFSSSLINHATMHHPSFPIFARERESLGLPKSLIPWNPHNVNAPACTFGPELARILPGLQPDDLWLDISFGAGVNGAITLYQVQ